VPEVRARIILLDVDLPTLNGLEVLRRLKAVEVTRVSNVIMLTGRTGEREVLTALELGAIDHITKPFSVPVLMHKVRTILKQSQ
jgi:DNA-binding response OmpR family regulator